MNNLIYLLQMIVALLLIGLIVLQAKGTGLGRSFSSSNYYAKRGIEKTVFVATIATAVLFLALSVITAY